MMTVLILTVGDVFKVNALMYPNSQTSTVSPYFFFPFYKTFSFFSPPQYSLIKDVVSSLKKHRMHEQQFTHHPLLILNNFGSDGMHIKLMATMFQNMFPSINVHKVYFSSRSNVLLVDSRFKALLA